MAGCALSIDPYTISASLYKSGIHLSNICIIPSATPSRSRITILSLIDPLGCIIAWQLCLIRSLILSTKGKIKYTNYKFRKNDLLIFGRESAGVPKKIHNSVDERLVIPIKKNLRSLNVSSSVAITLGECIRQLKLF